MSDKKIDDAIKYASSTNKIEDMNLSKNELEEVKKAIIDNKNSDKFVSEIVKKIDKSDKNGKIK